MSDLISRKEAIRALQELDMLKETRRMPEMHPEDFVIRMFLEAESMIEALPSVKPERHRGEWIEDGHERGFSECSKCGYIAVSVLSERHYNFCPNCGADMRGE